MPRDFQWSAPVLQADLDAFGELRSMSLLRSLQEAATRASSDAGFDTAYYDRTGGMWIIRRTQMRLESPARYGDVLDIRTWITDFRRVRSQRAYEVRSGNRLVARALSDWVFVDQRGRPRRIPPEWYATFGVAETHAATRTPFPETSPSAQAATFQRRIELHELDALRHVNNSNYTAYLEQAMLDMTEAAGCGFEAQIAAGGRLRAESHDLEYLDAALYGETIAVTTWLTHATADALEQHTHLHRGDPDRPLLQAHSRHRWIAPDDAPMPHTLRSAFRVP
ncbi:MAG: thioesterase family protein [Deltaproteobacteria bacterium]|nr:thioesterase family protein [Deltaproteobacteria bacterium]